MRNHQFTPGDVIVRIVGMPGYEKGFVYSVEKIVPYIKGEQSWLDHVHLMGVDIVYQQNGLPVDPYDDSFLLPIYLFVSDIFSSEE